MEIPASADTATETLRNALRLYTDARLLFEHGRYASCAALSVLAIEELAKFIALAGFQPFPSCSLRHHTVKQISAASFLLRSRYQATLREILLEERVGEHAAMYARLIAMEWNADEMALFDIVLGKMIADGSLRRFAQVYAGETNELKQLGLYVDIDKHGEIRATPTQITRETAEDQVGFVCDTLKALRARLPGGGCGDAISER